MLFARFFCFWRTFCAWLVDFVVEPLAHVQRQRVFDTLGLEHEGDATVGFDLLDPLFLFRGDATSGTFHLDLDANTDAGESLADGAANFLNDSVVVRLPLNAESNEPFAAFDGSDVRSKQPDVRVPLNGRFERLHHELFVEFFHYYYGQIIQILQRRFSL